MDGSNSSAGKFAACAGVVLLSGLAIGAAYVGAAYAARLLYQVLSGSRPEVAAAIITGAFTVIVAVVTVMVGRWAEVAGQVQKELREKKAPAYDKLMQFMFKVLFSGKAGATQVTEEEVIKALSEFTQQVMVWGADDVLAAWSTFRRESLKPDNGLKMLAAYEDLVYAIRRDLGHSNRGLKRGDVLRLFVNDIDSILSGGSPPILPDVAMPLDEFHSPDPQKAGDMDRERS